MAYTLPPHPFPACKVMSITVQDAELSRGVRYTVRVTKWRLRRKRHGPNSNSLLDFFFSRWDLRGSSAVRRIAGARTEGTEVLAIYINDDVTAAVSAGQSRTMTLRGLICELDNRSVSRPSVSLSSAYIVAQPVESERNDSPDTSKPTRGYWHRCG